MHSQITDVIVIGAGASGMMAAILAARSGCSVVVLEHKSEAGKKLLATGNGRCNFTNDVQGSACYRSETPAFLMPCLEQFGKKETLSFFQELGIAACCKNGYYYPRTLQARTVRESLMRELYRLGVTVCYQIGIREVKKTKQGFDIHCKDGIRTCHTLILATGGKTMKESGSDGSGYLYAMQLGHHCTPLFPALTALEAEESWLQITAGVRADAKVSLLVDETLICSDTGEVQFTKYGLSGIPVFQVSRYAAKACEVGSDVRIMLDFLPELSEAAIRDWIGMQMEHVSPLPNHKLTMQQIALGLLNEKIVAMLLRQDGRLSKSLDDFSEQKRQEWMTDFIALLKNFPCQIKKAKGFDTAQVTAGGISLAEVEPLTLQSRLHNGLYFAGELLDVDGICGGYNLQWAWASGYCAGSAAAAFRKEKHT